MATPSKKSVKRSSKSGARRSQGARAGLIIPPSRVSSALRKGRFSKRTSASSGVYLAAVMEYLCAELLELSAKATAQASSKARRITPRAINLAVKADADLGALLRNVTLSKGGVVPSLNKALESKRARK